MLAKELAKLLLEIPELPVLIVDEGEDLEDQDFKVEISDYEYYNDNNIIEKKLFLKIIMNT